MREIRKEEHIENYLKSAYKGDNLLSDIYIEYNALPELDFEQINTESELFGKTTKFPLMINAMTGGTEVCEEINADLARIAKEFSIPIALGSQKIALENDESIKTFSIVREIVGEKNVVIGNLSSNSSLKEVKRARNMIDADAMQLHVNPVQELVMKEGDRKFSGILENISSIIEELDQPVIVKEVGFGLSAQAASRLYDKGARYIDIAGHGGTNFVEIENNRRFDCDFEDFYPWGIPTAKILLDIKKDRKEDLFLISSGGLKSGQCIVKSFILGADYVGISGEILSYLLYGGYEQARDYVESLIAKTKIAMLLLGAKDLEDLKKIPYKVTGRLKELTE